MTRKERLTRLRAILTDEAVIRGREMRLASGRTSTVYFNVKKPLLNGEAIALIADEIVDRLAAIEFDLVGGMALGAVPLVAAVCARSWPERRLNGFFVRSEVKAHGTQSLIEGYFEAGQRVVLLEDVTTTGGSTLKAAEAVRAAGGTVNRAIIVIDRAEGAVAALAAKDIVLDPIFTSADFAD